MMAPRVSFNPEQIREKARRDLLTLLEGVCVPLSIPLDPMFVAHLSFR